MRPYFSLYTMYLHLHVKFLVVTCILYTCLQQLVLYYVYSYIHVFQISAKIIQQIYFTHVQSTHVCRILESLSRFSSLVEIPQNATNNGTSIFFTQSTYAILVQDIPIENFSSQAFSVDLGSVEEAIAGIADGEIDQDRLLMALNVLPNATASAEILLFDPEIVNKSGNVSNTERLFYTVFLSTSLFLTPSTDCDEFAIGSIILSVTFNVSDSSNRNATIILNFLQSEEVSAAILHHYLYHHVLILCSNCN